MTNIYPFTDKDGTVYLSAPKAQGDLTYIEVENIPSGLTSISPEAGVHILAHSETGHHHVLDRVDSVQRYQDVESEVTTFLKVVGDAVKLKHLRSHDTHGEHVIPAGNYKVTNGVQYTPEGMRRVVD